MPNLSHCRRCKCRSVSTGGGGGGSGADVLHEHEQNHDICKISHAFPPPNFNSVTQFSYFPTSPGDPPGLWMLTCSSLAP